MPFQDGSRVYQTRPTWVRLQAARRVPLREQRLILVFFCGIRIGGECEGEGEKGVGGG